MKTGPIQEKEVEIAMASTTGDPKMDFNLIQEAIECSTLNFEDTKDPNSAPGPSTDGANEPMSPVIEKPKGPVIDDQNGPVENDPTPSMDDNPDYRDEVNFSPKSHSRINGNTLLDILDKKTENVVSKVYLSNLNQFVSSKN